MSFKVFRAILLTASNVSSAKFEDWGHATYAKVMVCKETSTAKIKYCLYKEHVMILHESDFRYP